MWCMDLNFVCTIPMVDQYTNKTILLHRNNVYHLVNLLPTIRDLLGGKITNTRLYQSINLSSEACTNKYITFFKILFTSYHFFLFLLILLCLWFCLGLILVFWSFYLTVFLLPLSLLSPLLSLSRFGWWVLTSTDLYCYSSNTPIYIGMRLKF